jgi:hypothetical protein
MSRSLARLEISADQEKEWDEFVFRQVKNFYSPNEASIFADYTQIIWRGITRRAEVETLRNKWLARFSKSEELKKVWDCIDSTACRSWVSTDTTSTKCFGIMGSRPLLVDSKDPTKLVPANLPEKEVVPLLQIGQSRDKNHGGGDIYVTAKSIQNLAQAIVQELERGHWQQEVHIAWAGLGNAEELPHFYQYLYEVGCTKGLPKVSCSLFYTTLVYYLLWTKMLYIFMTIFPTTRASSTKKCL